MARWVGAVHGRCGLDRRGGATRREDARGTTVAVQQRMQRLSLAVLLACALVVPTARADEAPSSRIGCPLDDTATKRARENARRAAIDVMPTLEAYHVPARPDASPPPTTYWKHLAWVKVRVAYAAGFGKVRTAVDNVRALASLSPALATRIAELDAELAAADAMLAATVAELRRVRMPKHKVDAARSKIVKQSFVGWDAGTQVGLVVSVPGVARSAWQEKVEVRRTSDKIYYRVYPTKRETYLVHEGYRPTPATATAPALPGVAADEICEIRGQEFTRFTKGPPSWKRTWHETFFEVTGYVLCANVDATTTMPEE